MSAYKKLNANDVKITPFEAHKQYTINQTGTGSSGVSGSYSFFTASWTSESKDLFNDGNRRYYQLDHLYYRDFITTLGDKLDVSDVPYTKQERRLYEKANVLGISQKNFGSEIQPETFSLTGSFNGSQYHIKDDGLGNLYDVSKGTTNFVDERNRVLYIGPVKGFKKYDLTTDNNTGQTLVNPPSRYDAEGIYDDSYYLNKVKYVNMLFSETSTTISPSLQFELQAVHDYLEIPHNNIFNFDDDFSICLRTLINAGHLLVILAYFNVIGKLSLINKRGEVPVVLTPQEGISTLSLNTNTTGSSQIHYDIPPPQYSFDIYFSILPGAVLELTFEISDGVNTNSISVEAAGTGFIGDHHYVFQKTGNQLEIWDNGTKKASGSVTVNMGSTKNHSPIYIGTYGSKDYGTGFRDPVIADRYASITGQLQQIQIFNKALLENEITAVSESLTSTKTVGNIFYDSGITTITHPLYQDVLGNVSSSDDWTATYKNTHLIYEHEINCTVDESDFTQTRNITARKIQSMDSPDLADFATGSLFKPYVTTVGLYNDEGDLLVVGKLGQPTKTSTETDTTFIIRYDT